MVEEVNENAHEVCGNCGAIRAEEPRGMNGLTLLTHRAFRVMFRIHNGRNRLRRIDKSHYWVNSKTGVRKAIEKANRRVPSYLKERGLIQVDADGFYSITEDGATIFKFERANYNWATKKRISEWKNRRSLGKGKAE